MNGTMLRSKTESAAVNYENDCTYNTEKNLSAFSMAAVGGSILINVGIVIYAVISAIAA